MGHASILQPLGVLVSRRPSVILDTMLRPALLALAAALATGCTSFESDWKGASDGTPGSITGRWTGSWQNTNNTHGGPLKAVLKPDGPDGYTARVHAEWGSHSGSFRTPIHGRFEDGTYVFTGSRRIVGMKIATAGRISPTNFVATYDSAFDRGTFTLKRPDR